ncbi:extensin family protein [Flaviflagellibacter deserti]|uniref:Extensin family protein n=1 Tax=Flaviflagellibacter deserti TaxID=2267266 RepID=A0ABV9Z6R3_9HYPH
MSLRIASRIAAIALAGLVASCGAFDFEQREPWRDAAELQCLRAGGFTRSASAEMIGTIDGPGTCGLEHPFKVSALADGSVAVEPAARLGCPVAAALNRWMTESVQPAAYANFGQPIVGIKNAASYGCRTRNNKRGEKLSEHSFGNALDIRAFVLANGREISVTRGWNGAPDERAFLRQVIGSACGPFRTVLGPGVAYHDDHIHLDLARHNSRWTSYCRPRPTNVPAAPQMIPQQPSYDAYPRGYPPQQPALEPYYSPDVPMSYADHDHLPTGSVPDGFLHDPMDE